MGFLTDALQKIQTELDDSGISSSLHKSMTSSSRSSSKHSTTRSTRSTASNSSSRDGSSVSSSSTSTSSSSISMASVMHYESNATRWEKAVVGVDTIVKEVVKFDPDGVDIVMVGGSSTTIQEEESEALSTTEEDVDSNDTDNDVEWYRNIQDTQGLDDLITSKEPNGDCPLGKAMKEVLTEALSRDLKTNPCSILVLTAGKPSDSELLEETLQHTAQTIADSGGVKMSPLSVTFIQIGTDEEASNYLQYLDKKIGAATTSPKIELVDTMPYSEIQETMNGMSQYQHHKDANKSKKSALVGVVAGAAIGMGGMYLYSKKKAKKRIQSGSWQGKWKCYYLDEEIATLEVTDDKAGNITIDGLVDTMHGTYNNGNDNDNEDFVIQFTDPTGEVITGDFQEELFTLEWSDGTRWEALNKTNWGGYVASAAAGAAIVGATGYGIEKKFFQQMKAKDQCDYILVVDRSLTMTQRDK
mmetsp:Transcript_5516/g.6376  ORF Transcript_5516/g.6376 Transcript_5516/m.6376 type:complete len:471 (+) Transcript_5516:165-1577(+)